MFWNKASEQFEKNFKISLQCFPIQKILRAFKMLFEYSNRGKQIAYFGVLRGGGVVVFPLERMGGGRVFYHL